MSLASPRPRTAEMLRASIQQSAQLLRTLADETAAAAVAAQRARDLDDNHDDGIELSYPHDQDADMEGATDFSIAMASLQTELDGLDLDMDLASKRATSLRAAIQLLTKRPRLAHSSDVAKTHLKVKYRARPDAATASSPS